MRHLLLHDPSGALDDRISTAGGELQDLQSIADRRKRISELMGKSREKSVLAPVHPAQGRLHLLVFGDVVDRYDKLLDLVGSIVHRRSIEAADKKPLTTLASAHLQFEIAHNLTAKDLRWRRRDDCGT